MVHPAEHGHSEGINGAADGPQPLLPPLPGTTPPGTEDAPLAAKVPPTPNSAGNGSPGRESAHGAPAPQHKLTDPSPPAETMIDAESETLPEQPDAGQIKQTTGGIIFDRSKAQLRIPEALVNECLRFTQALSLSLSVGDSKSAGADKVRADNSELVNRLRAARVIVDDQLDPMAEELLSVCSQASLIIKVNLSYATESSTSTVWATPRQAVVSSSIDPHYAEFRPVDVAQLPLVLGDLMVLRRPKYVGQSPVSVGTKAVAEAETQLGDAGKATSVLEDAGLSAEQAQLIIDFQGADVRRWRVSSSWSTDDGTETSELRGLDAGASGQWLVAMTGNRDEPGQMTFTPQGSGDVVRALRSVLPRSWVGTPLRRQVAG